MIKQLRHILLTVLVFQLLCISVIKGQDASSRTLHVYAKKMVDNLNLLEAHHAGHTITGFEELDFGNGVTVEIANLSPGGFIIFAVNNNHTEVIGFSADEAFPAKGDRNGLPVMDVIEAIAGKACSLYKTPGAPDQLTETIYGPYVYTLWGQVNCQNNQGQPVYVTNYFTPNHYAAGCVAISLATLLHYYTWPLSGVGFHEYYDGYGSSTGTYSADFGNTVYQWNQMLNKYNNQPSTQAQREAAGELAFHTAVALEMDFEYNGSTSNVNLIPGTGSDYFRFYSFYKSESSAVFWTRLDKNMVEANPVILSVSSNSGYGHSIVCDGLWLTDGEDRFYHLNMGWWGSGNGWFKIHEDFNAGGYTIVNGGVLDFIPEPILDEPGILPDTNMFFLNWHYPQTIEANGYEVQRKINSGSWETIAEDYSDTSLLVLVDDLANNYYFRVRAKVNDAYYPASWSNEAQLGLITATESPEPENEIEVYPTPFDNRFMVRGLEAYKTVTIDVRSMTGQQIFSRHLGGISEVTIPTDSWNEGVYLVRINADKNHQLIKIIKK